MSFYSTWEGEIKFKKEVFKDAVEIMDTWLDPVFKEDDDFYERCELRFPEMFEVGDVGRNIHRGIEALKNLGFKGTLAGWSSDGCFEGYVIQDSEEKPYVDLKEFSKTLGEGFDLDLLNEDEQFDEYCELMNEIGNQWLDSNL